MTDDSRFLCILIPVSFALVTSTRQILAETKGCQFSKWFVGN